MPRSIRESLKSQLLSGLVLEAPWIMFEAGAISRVVEGRVCPIVFDCNKTDLVGPLASFQATAFNKTEVRQLLTTINNAGKDAALTETSLNAAFNMWWPELEKKVGAILSAEQPPEGPHRSERDLLEEAVTNTRTLLREFQAIPPWQRHNVPDYVGVAREALRQAREPWPPAKETLDEIMKSGLTAKSE